MAPNELISGEASSSAGRVHRHHRFVPPLGLQEQETDAEVGNKPPLYFVDDMDLPKRQRSDERLHSGNQSAHRRKSSSRPASPASRLPQYDTFMYGHRQASGLETHSPNIETVPPIHSRRQSMDYVEVRSVARSDSMSEGSGNYMEREPEYQNDFETREQLSVLDLWLPIANVARVMKAALPEDAKIRKDTKECMQECVSEFISFVTSWAAEKAAQEKRLTMNGEDILEALRNLSFENYAEALSIYLSKYRESQTQKYSLRTVSVMSADPAPKEFNPKENVDKVDYYLSQWMNVIR